MRRSTTAVVAGVAAAAAVVVIGPASGSPAGVWAATGRVTAEGSVCDHDGMETALRTAFDPAVGYTVVAVAVAGLDARCAGHRLSVALTDDSGAMSAQGGPVVVPPGGGELTVAIPPVAVAVAARVHTLLD